MPINFHAIPPTRLAINLFHEYQRDIQAFRTHTRPHRRKNFDPVMSIPSVMPFIDAESNPAACFEAPRAGNAVWISIRNDNP